MTGLLVSVRDAQEATVALQAGVDLLDVKEPDRGSLGRADSRVILEVLKVAARRLPVSAALGELREYFSTDIRQQASGLAEQNRNGESQRREKGVEIRVETDRQTALIEEAALTVPQHLTFAKLGLAGCGDWPDWPSHWAAALRTFPSQVGPVAVVYADWKTAKAPSPEEILHQGRRLGCRAALLDTFEKNGSSLFDHFSKLQTAQWIDDAKSKGMVAVVAGSLSVETVPLAAALDPDYVAVRGAACLGSRNGPINAECIARLIESLRAAI